MKTNYGTVPVHEDGSAYFKAPSNTELYFIALNGNGKEIQRMGSVTQITTGERASCVDCHEDRLSAPVVHRPDYDRMQSPPDQITPPPWGAGPVDYVKQVQPVLDQYCVKCHSGPNPKANVDLSGDTNRFFNMSFVNLVIKRRVVDYYYINAAPTGVFPALMTGSWTSKLTRMIESKHAKVDVDNESRRRIYAWIDANVPYYSTWDMTRPHTTGGRDVFYRTIKSSGMQQPGRITQIEPWAKKLQALVKKMNGKRSRLSHGDINLTHPEYSHILTMNLARSAGGNADDKKAIFKSKTEPLFVDILNALKEGKAALEATPRMDMPGAKPLPQERNFGRPL